MKLAVLFLVVSLTAVQGLNIVVYFTLAAKSHLSFFNSLINVLTEKGHTVDTVIAHMNPTVEWKGKLKIRNSTVFEFPSDSPWLSAKHYLNPFEEQPRFQFDHYYDTSTRLCEIGLSSGEPLRFVKSGNYDAMLSTSYDYCGFFLAHATGIKSVMTISSLNILPHESVNLGIPSPISSVADTFDAQRGSFSLLANMFRLYDQFLFRRTYAEFLQNQTNLARTHFGSNFPPVQELIDKIDVLFVNSNEVIETGSIISHKIQYIGGIGLEKPKSLTKDFEDILSLPSKGVVLVSFGTQVPSHLVELRVRKAFAFAFSQFPDNNFIFKHSIQEGDEKLFGNVTNVKFVDWLPQTDLLYDKRVVGFITHCGLNSFLESSYAGVPMITIPLFADQMHNARSAVRLGTAVDLHKVHFTGDHLKESLEIMLHGEAMRERAVEVAKMLASRPNSPNARFLEWVEFAATTPGFYKSVNLPNASIGIVKYYCLDIFVIAMAVLFFVFFIVFKYIFQSSWETTIKQKLQ